jgi:restriction system protein
MGVPNYQAFLLPILKTAAKGEIAFREMAEQSFDMLRLSEEDRAEMIPSGQMSTAFNRAGWARTYLSKAGLLERTRRSHYRATPEGMKVLAEGHDALNVTYLRRFPSFQAFKERAQADDPQAADSSEEHALRPLESSESEGFTPDDLIRQAYARLEGVLAEELLQRILDAPPAFFETVVVQLLLAMGYGGTRADAGRALGRSGDGGVDGVIDEDALGLDRVYVQAKRYAAGATVGPGAVQAFFGALDNFKAAKGLLVTTSSFTKGAMDTAERFSKRVVLIDGYKLTRLMIRYGVGCRVEETLKIMKIDEDFFE